MRLALLCADADPDLRAAGIFQRADGSAYFEQGNTKVIALVYGPREVTLRSKVTKPRFSFAASQDLTSFSVQALHDRAIITCEYSMANFSSTEPKKKSKGDRRATEISMVIRQTFETVLMTQLFPRSQIDIFVQIIQADGGSLRRAVRRAHAHFYAGTRCAAINAACLAAIDAGIPMKDFVVACAAGCIANTPILGASCDGARRS